jgi:hypothetical protein
MFAGDPIKVTLVGDFAALGIGLVNRFPMKHAKSTKVSNFERLNRVRPHIKNLEYLPIPKMVVNLKSLTGTAPACY